MLMPIYKSFAHASDTLNEIKPVDYFLAKEVSETYFTGSLVHTNSNKLQHELLFHLVIALSQHVFEGHTCLPINTIANTRLGFASDKDGNITKQGYNFPTFQDIESCLSHLALNFSDNQLLVLKEQSLYLRRYATFENELENQLSQRITINEQYAKEDIAHVVTTLFPNESTQPASNTVTSKAKTVALINDDIDWQKVAVANALNKNFSVIAGGPGTGKTYTVTKLLAALVMLNNQAKQSNLAISSMRFALAAPTGKAAQRLSESIVQAVEQFSGSIEASILHEIPTEALTIHRLLGYIPNSPNFRHHKDNLLPIDFLLIDEASMVDLALLTRVFRALPSHAKIVLLGDADQLPSVAVGNVLADIAPRPHAGYSQNNQRYLHHVTHYQLPCNKQSSVDYLTFLIKSRRFDGEGGIGQLAKAVIAGDVKTSWALLFDNSNTGKSHHEASLNDSTATAEKNTPLGLLIPNVTNRYTNNGHNNNEFEHLTDSAAFIRFIDTYYLPLFKSETPQQAFNILHQFRILCATRVGQEGVEYINEKIIQYFQQKGLLTSRYASNPITQNTTVSSSSILPNIFHTMPILVLENHHKLGIYNGDIGIIWRNEDGHLLAAFETNNLKEYPEGVKYITPSRLPKFQPVYAMTIHKTQGSEFANVLMVLPQQRENKLLSRELLYTGITRAKQHITIASLNNVWRQAVETKVTRFSNLTLSPKT